MVAEKEVRVEKVARQRYLLMQIQVETFMLLLVIECCWMDEEVMLN